MSTFRVKIKTDGAAFEDDDGERSAYTVGREVARILQRLARDVESNGLAALRNDWGDAEASRVTLRDINGNQAGTATFV